MERIYNVYTIDQRKSRFMVCLLNAFRHQRSNYLSTFAPGSWLSWRSKAKMVVQKKDDPDIMGVVKGHTVLPAKWPDSSGTRGRFAPD